MSNAALGWPPAGNGQLDFGLCGDWTFCPT
jgi:hypothetical protein